MGLCMWFNTTKLDNKQTKNIVGSGYCRVYNTLGMF